jgi:hypothetical protein
MTEINEFWFGNDENGAEAWTIENDQSADWAMKKIKEAETDFDKWKTFYNSMIDKAERRKDRTVAYMTEKLKQYFETVPHKESKTQEKYSLPSGDLVMKKPKSVWEHEDDEALLEWVKENGFSDCIKVTERVSWSDVKKRLKEDSNGIVCDSETGLVCEAVKATMSEPEFVLTINK